MKRIELTTSIGSVKLNDYIMNASGPRCTTEEELLTITTSASAAVVTKSCTVELREGNQKPRYKKMNDGAIQSMGLPNLGYHAYLDMLPKLSQQNKPIFISVAGLSLADNVEMISAFQQSTADLLEINFSCPNIIGKSQLGYDFEQLDNTLATITTLGDKPLGLKLPAYFDLVQFKQVADIINKYPVSFITCVNSIGHTLVIDSETETPVLRANKGFGGLSGSCIKPIGLANVRTFRSLLRPDIDIIGVGGIASGQDAFEYLLAGANAVQIATCFQEEGVSCFSRVLTEFYEIMANKGYQSIKQAKGKLALR
jgi:dihydroorotate dehydrogenase (fumarate)